MKAQRSEVPEAMGHLKLQVQHAKNKEREESNKEGNMWGSQTKTKPSLKSTMWCGSGPPQSGLPLSRPRGSSRGLQAAKAAAGPIKMALGSGRINWSSPSLLL